MRCPHCDGTGQIEHPRLGDAVLARRKHVGLTQQELSIKAGVSRPQIANIEAGRSDVPVSTLLRLADALNCKAGDLLP